MKIIEPVNVTESMLTTNVLNIESDWASGTYNEGDRVVVDDSVYEALVTTTQNPVGSDEWFRVGYSNIWRMWTEGADSMSTRDGGITVTLAGVPLLSAVAVLGAVGYECRVTLTDGLDVVFDATKALVDIGVSDWWEYYFTDYDQLGTVYFDNLPPYPGADLQIVVSTALVEDTSAIGRVVFGVERDIGVTLQGVQTRIEDYSRKDRDGFGNLILIPRRTIRLVDYDFMIENPLIDIARRRFQALAARPTLFVGYGDLPETITFGVYTNFSTISDGDGTITECSATIEEF
jgi:hypothetical protein